MKFNIHNQQEDFDRLVGTLNENLLHAQLKYYYADKPEDMEKMVDSYVIDVLRGDVLIEIQTQNFSSIKKKLKDLIKYRKVLLVYPIYKKKIITKIHPQTNKRLNSRKSPKEENYYELFKELVRIPKLLKNPNFEIELVLTEIEEFRVNDGKGSWKRGGWSILDRKLLQIYELKRLTQPTDLLDFIPNSIPEEFTNKDITDNLHIPKYIAQKVTYCCRKIGVIEKIGTKARYSLYERINLS